MKIVLIRPNGSQAQATLYAHLLAQSPAQDMRLKLFARKAAP